MWSSLLRGLCGLSILGLRLASALESSNSSLPVVDLGYELHQAAYLNETGGFYNFSNIRYAAPPLGQLRFAAPQAPELDRSQVQTGSLGRVCPQASPAWILTAYEFLPAYLTGQPFNASSMPSSSSGELPAQDPRTTEDCLFLDIAVPQAIFDGAGKGAGAPVLVWIYGGGYTAGEKSSVPPAGLIERGNDGVIFVALNYRLGAFGWLSGPTFQSNGTANAGLHDQRFALEWVQNYIHLFGGDANRVTVIGESAGAGSIMHQITAYGGKFSPTPFAQAILQSPGWQPIASNYEQESQFNTFLSLLNVSTIQQARQLPSSALITANIVQVGLSPYSSFTFGPTVDGDFVPALPGILLLHGQFNHSLNILTGHNANEGLLFTNPAIQSDAAYRNFTTQTFPVIEPAVRDYIADILYPPVFDGTQGYRDETGRVAKSIAESVFTCNTNYLARAYNNASYAYRFSVPPAIHGQDVPYTFYNDGPASPVGSLDGVQNVTVALALQEVITSFAVNGKPAGIPQYGPEAQILDLGDTGIAVTADETANSRCLWWQKALYY